MRGKQLRFFSSDDGKKIAGSRQVINLPLDTIALLLVVVVLLLTISFSLGVERGRKVAYTGLISDMKETLNPAQQITPMVMPQEPLVRPEAKEELKEEIIEKKIETKPEKRYSIQVASFRKTDTALKEAEKLKDKGYPVEVTKKGKYVVIFVGDFEDKKEAEKNMQSLRENYKDCFIRTYPTRI